MSGVSSDFEGLVAVVTGGSSGIGLSAAQLLASRGAHVELLDIAAPPAGITDDWPAHAVGYVTCDVADDESVRAAVQTASREE